MSVALKIENISKSFKRSGYKQPYKSLREDLMQLFARKKEKKFTAIDSISFDVNTGETLGIIGRNGAGKSTLLKLISGISLPDSGKIYINGSVSSLLELGTGFHPELTGYENILFSGALLGMSKKEVLEKADEIIAFAGLEDFIQTPVKHYSSGMQLRLGFSVNAHLNAEIILIDEVLAVGDAAFQKKCFSKVDKIKRSGKTILLVSHQLEQIKKYCNRVIWIDEGKIMAAGNAEETCALYLNSLTTAKPLTEVVFKGSLSESIRFTAVSINEREQELRFSPAQELRFTYTFEVNNALFFRSAVSILKDDIRLFTLHDFNEAVNTPEGTHQVSFTLPAHLLRPGRYTIALGGHDTENTHWIWAENVTAFTIDEVWDELTDPTAHGIFTLSTAIQRKRL